MNKNVLWCMQALISRGYCGGMAAGTENTLVGRFGVVSLVAAVIVFAANMAVAWIVVFDAQRTISQQLVLEGQRTAVSMALEQEHGDDANHFVFKNRVLDTELLARAVQNRNAVTVVGTGLAFSLVAVGFALFVLGADGAFKLEVDGKDRGKIIFNSTAPGLLCFILAAFLGWTALSDNSQLQLSSLPIVSDGNQDSNVSDAIRRTECASGERPPEDCKMFDPPPTPPPPGPK